MRVHSLATLALAVLVAGCAASEGANPQQGGDDVAFNDDKGAIEGRVIDDALTPLPNAVVTITDPLLSATADESGEYQFSNLAPGTYILTATLDGYSTAQAQLEVVSGAATSHDFTISLLASSEAYHATQIKKGRILCGLAWRVPPGPEPVGDQSGYFAVCGALYNTPASSFDSFVVPFDLTSQNVSAVKAFVFETSWIRTQTFGSGLQVFWEIYQEITPTYDFTEDLRTIAEVTGTSPLRVVADEYTVYNNVTGYKDPAPKYCQENGPCKYWARVFPYSSTLGDSSPVDFATYADQGYDHYSTEFYGAPPPEGYSALLDS